MAAGWQVKPSDQQVAAALKVTSVVYEAICAAGSAGVPSGHLYAATMGTFQSLQAYESCIGALVRAGLVERCNHVLTARAPRPGSTT